MTTYSTIADADIDQDSPITQTLMTALRDNVLAIQQGDSTAPHIASRALDLSFVTGTRTSAGVICTMDATVDSNIADARLALMCGVISATAEVPGSASVQSDSVASPAIISQIKVAGSGGSPDTDTASFAFLYETGGDTSFNLNMTVSGISGATVHAAIILLGR
tara:strand:- start:197 stop:688 length:492 start_codon:yes stop_codon:yes gene_type:complete